MDNKKDLLNDILKRTSKKEPVGDERGLTCAKAFELAQKYEMGLIEIGRMCNKHNIKICKCQLGCFQ